MPQGTLVERLRAGGAGLAGIFTPTGVGTPIAEGKEVRFFDGKPFLFEPSIKVDYAFVSAYRADRYGNCEFRGSSQHFNPSFAKAARVAIVEVDEIVEPGEIDPHRIGLPGSFVARVVKRTIQPGSRRPGPLPPRARLGADVQRQDRLDAAQLAEKAAELLPEPGYVNLGLGIPTLVANYLGRSGHRPARGKRDSWLRPAGDRRGRRFFVHDAGGKYVAYRPGASYFDSVTAFEMVRAGKIDVVVLGAYQVDEAGNVANWATPEQVGGGIGGAMDMVASGRTVMVLMEHRDSRDRAKLVRSCTYPLTGADCVDIVVTDLAVLRRVGGRFRIEEVAPGFTRDEVAALTEMDLSGGICQLDAAKSRPSHHVILQIGTCADARRKYVSKPIDYLSNPKPEAICLRSCIYLAPHAP